MQQIFCSYLFLNSHVTPQVLYREDLGRATPTPVTPEIERVKRNQENFSSVLFLIWKAAISFLINLKIILTPKNYSRISP